MSEKRYCVYKHTSPSGKVYIGITSLNVNTRWANGQGYRSQKVFYRAIKKYGWNNFSHEILFSNLTENEAKNKEIDLIKKYKSNCTKWQNPTYGYNSTDGGDSRTHNLKTSNETKFKLSNSTYSLKKKRKIDCFDLNGNFLITYDSLKDAALDNDIATTNISKCCRMRIKSLNGKMYRYHEDTLGNNITHYKLARRKTSKYVSQYDLNGNFLRTFDTLSEIEQLYGWDAANIADCCNGRYSTSHGFVWRFGTKDEIGKVDKTVDHTIYKKQIDMYDLNGCFLKRFNCINDARKYVGKPNERNITKVLAGKRNKAHGYIWKYVQEVT